MYGKFEELKFKYVEVIKMQNFIKIHFMVNMTFKNQGQCH